jgi:hypothetical protein
MKPIKFAALMLSAAMLLCSCGASETEDGGDNRITQESETATTTAAATLSENAVTAAESIDIDITFTQTADATVISITSSAVSQFVSETQKDKSIENSFYLTFLPSEANGGFFSGYTMKFEFLGDSQNAMFSDLSAQKSYYSDNGQYPDLLFALEGDTAVWSIGNADMKLDKIETVEVYAYVGEDNPNTAMLRTILPISEITVGSELPLPDESKLPYSITGVYNTGSHNSTLGEELLFVSAVPGGYSISYGDYVSPIMQAGVNSGGGINLERETDGEKVSFFSGNDPNFQSGMLYVKDKSGNEIYHFDGRKAQIHPGSYSYLDAATGAPVEYIKMEIENGLFKFIIADEYTTEWLSPKTVTESQIIFDVTKYVGNQVVTEVILMNTHNRLFPQAGLFIEFAEYSPLRGGLLFGDVDESASAKYYGTYKTAEGKAEHTVVIDENGVTIDGQFTVACSVDEIIYGRDWKTLSVDGSSLSSPIFSWEFDGARQSIRIYDTYLTGDGKYFDAFLQ